MRILKTFLRDVFAYCGNNKLDYIFDSSSLQDISARFILCNFNEEIHVRSVFACVFV